MPLSFFGCTNIIFARSLYTALYVQDKHLFKLGINLYIFIAIQNIYNKIL